MALAPHLRMVVWPPMFRPHIIGPMWALELSSDSILVPLPLCFFKLERSII
jgi:hypothetical protein